MPEAISPEYDASNHALNLRVPVDTSVNPGVTFVDLGYKLDIPSGVHLTIVLTEVWQQTGLLTMSMATEQSQGMLRITIINELGIEILVPAEAHLFTAWLDSPLPHYDRVEIKHRKHRPWQHMPRHNHPVLYICDDNTQGNPQYTRVCTHSRCAEDAPMLSQSDLLMVAKVRELD